jgi:hypothetical protein
MSDKHMVAKQEFIDGWYHFCDRINFGQSPLDAEAIQYMNEFTRRLEKVIEEARTTHPDEVCNGCGEIVCNKAVCNKKE